MSCSTCAAFGSPRVFVNCKTYSRSAAMAASIPERGSQFENDGFLARGSFVQLKELRILEMPQEESQQVARLVKEPRNRSLQSKG